MDNAMYRIQIFDREYHMQVISDFPLRLDYPRSFDGVDPDFCFVVSTGFPTETDIRFMTTNPNKVSINNPKAFIVYFHDGDKTRAYVLPEHHDMIEYDIYQKNKSKYSWVYIDMTCPHGMMFLFQSYFEFQKFYKGIMDKLNESFLVQSKAAKGHR